MLTILCCAKKESSRLPGKNWKLLGGKPLIEYTLDVMKYIEQNIDCKLLVVTDSEECKKIADKFNIPVLWDVMTNKGMDFSRWIHENVNSDKYVILQPTNPARKKEKIVKWILACIVTNIKSAYSALRQNRDLSRMNGNFFYYQASQLLELDLVDSNSMIFLESYDTYCDINNIEQFKLAERMLK